jgi:hypothetical protein
MLMRVVATLRVGTPKDKASAVALRAMADKEGGRRKAEVESGQKETVGEVWSAECGGDKCRNLDGAPAAPVLKMEGELGPFGKSEEQDR